MPDKTVTIVNKLGLHARAAAKFVTLASSFASDIKVARNGQEVNGKSIMGVMMLAASKGTEITLITNGSDETEAIDKAHRTCSGALRRRRMSIKISGTGVSRGIAIGKVHRLEQGDVEVYEAAIPGTPNRG